jgi:hypothetical protein
MMGSSVSALNRLKKDGGNTSPERDRTGEIFVQLETSRQGSGYLPITNKTTYETIKKCMSLFCVTDNEHS